MNDFLHEIFKNSPTQDLEDEIFYRRFKDKFNLNNNEEIISITIEKRRNKGDNESYIYEIIATMAEYTFDTYKYDKLIYITSYKTQVERFQRVFQKQLLEYDVIMKELDNE